MIRGFYTSLSGILASMTRQSIVADNLANLNTVGFRQSRSTTVDFGLELAGSAGTAGSAGGPIGRLGTAAIATALTLDRAQGPLEQTGLPTDLAIEGDGLFVVATPGGLAGTRAGNFRVDAAGLLVTEAGYPVLDTTGRPILTGGTVTVGPDGTVAGTGQRIALAVWPAGEPVRRGETLVGLSGPLPAGSGAIRQGALERSNTDVAEAMTELVALQRLFGISSRALSIQDQTLADAAQLGRLR